MILIIISPYSVKQNLEAGTIMATRNTSNSMAELNYGHQKCNLRYHATVREKYTELLMFFSLLSWIKI